MACMCPMGVALKMGGGYFRRRAVVRIVNVMKYPALIAALSVASVGGKREAC